ncbi:T-cell surface glycoprotein CD3 zeta chain-like [Cololabis saira]|uniref:T-cell surface glycoprotein CD3 zeta chain-like n=1 Tax=Cololabis saira TaxID=129043 RepID=UPI002AD229DF|nr:T-cell surface glycoprotein CD3 zeta chain-like [Cololabis saira]
MDTLRTGELVLLVLLVLLGPVSCRDNFFTEPVICYFLDGFLFIYCITATALFFREKFSFIPAEEGTAGEKEGIYQELERPGNDVYQVLDQKKPKVGDDLHRETV